MRDDFDGILIGAGHNSLVLQAYLGKAGLRTLCLERRHEAGGGLATLEDPRFPGYLHNTHSFFHRAIRQAPWYADLELKRHGARYIEPELNVALIPPQGEPLEWWCDFEKTVASFEAFSRRDAATLRRWRETFLPILEKILVPESRNPPLPAAERRALLEKSALGRTLLETSVLSPLEFVEREFEHPTVKAGLLFFNGLREVDLRCPGFGHHIPMLLASPGKAQLCRGGSAALGKALVSAVVESGGVVRTGVEPKRILVENGRAVGVETSDGEVILARRFVASGLNPQQTFLELLEPALLPAEWRRKAEAFQYNLLAPLFALNVCLDEVPRYRAAETHPQLDRAFMVILGLTDFAQHSQIVKHHEAGTIPPTVMWGATPTLFDPSQAPAGKHTAFMWEKLPYRLGGDPRNWDKARDEHGRAMLKLWTEYAPNLEGAVSGWFTRSPLDTERTLANMRGGDLLVGAFSHGQIGADRPFPGAGHYRTIVDGLYLCASSSHPGGNVTGLPGYNSAQVLLADLGLAAPWAPEPVQAALARL